MDSPGPATSRSRACALTLDTARPKSAVLPVPRVVVENLSDMICIPLKVEGHRPPPQKCDSGASTLSRLGVHNFLSKHLDFLADRFHIFENIVGCHAGALDQFPGNFTRIFDAS